MSYPVVLNGITYQVPVTGDVNWGPPLTRYLVALGTLAYYQTQSSNPATAGVLRLAVGDTIDWRNNANTGNLPLGINGSDQLTFNGTIIGSASGVLTLTGTAHQINVSSSTGNITLSTPQDIDTVSSPTFANLTLTNPLPIADGGTGTTTPSLVAGTNVTITGTWPDQTINATASGSVINSGVATHLPYYASTGTVLSDSNYVTFDGTGILIVTNPAAPVGLDLIGQSAVAQFVGSGGDGFQLYVDSENTFYLHNIVLGQTIWSSTGGGMTINYPLSMSSQQINNLAAGVASTDAVNVGQLGSAVSPNIAASGTTGISAAATTVTSVSLTSHGNPVVIMANATFTITVGGVGTTLTCTVDDGSIVPMGCISAFTDVLVSSTTAWQTTIIGAYTPSAGTRTYTLKYSATGSPGVTVTYDSLVVYEL
jgi:fibronectin-binding autotransporter adhesin